MYFNGIATKNLFTALYMDGSKSHWAKYLAVNDVARSYSMG